MRNQTSRIIRLIEDIKQDLDALICDVETFRDNAEDRNQAGRAEKLQEELDALEEARESLSDCINSLNESER
jgi:hypothetical protein